MRTARDQMAARTDIHWLWKGKIPPGGLGHRNSRSLRARAAHLSYLQKKMSALSVPTAMSASDHVTAPSRIFFRASHTTSAYVINHLP